MFVTEHISSERLMEKILYTDRYFLNNLVESINPANCRLSVSLQPNIPELLKGIKDFYKNSNSRKPNFEESFEEALKLYALCNKHSVLPFWTLIFDSKSGEPEIKYEGPKTFTNSIHSEPLRTCRSPIPFAEDRRWYGIGIHGFSGEKDVTMMQNSVAEFVKRDYITTSIDLRIFHEKDEILLSAERGNVLIYGKMPEDSKLETALFSEDNP